MKKLTFTVEEAGQPDKVYTGLCLYTPAIIKDALHEAYREGREVHIAICEMEDDCHKTWIVEDMRELDRYYQENYPDQFIGIRVFKFIETDYV